MAMAMRPAMAAVASARPRSWGGLLFSGLSSTFPIFSSPSNQAEKPPAADPNPNLFISGLSKRTTSEGLKEAFKKYGEVISARIVTDRVSGYSKGFGFVRYSSTEEATEAVKGMHGTFLDGWVIFAEYARPRPRPPPPRFGNEGANGPSYGREEDSR